MEESKRYKKLFVWEKAHQFALKVYMVTKTFPREENFGITGQLRRAALSVPVNLVEGQARRGSKTFKQFCSIALGSLAESEYLLEFSRELGYLKEETYIEAEVLDIY